MTTVGRKRSLNISFLMIIGGWLILTFPRKFWMLYVGRTVLGLGHGLSAPVVPVYIGEVAETRIRGRLLSMYTINFTLALMTCYILGYFFRMYVLTLVITVILTCFGLCLFWIPESPYYRVSICVIIPFSTHCLYISYQCTERKKLKRLWNGLDAGLMLKVR